MSSLVRTLSSHHWAWAIQKLRDNEKDTEVAGITWDNKQVIEYKYVVTKINDNKYRCTTFRYGDEVAFSIAKYENDVLIL